MHGSREAGVADTDAVNVSQLKQVSDGAVKYDVVNGAVDYTSITLNPGGSPTTIHNLADGVLANDAVNFSQLTEATNKWITGNPDPASSYSAPSASGLNSLAAGSGAISSGRSGASTA